MPTSASLLSVFSGVGGLDLGLEKAGFTVEACIELDPTARRSLKANGAGAWNVLEPGDVAVQAKQLRPVDLGMRVGDLTLLAGAPPCQPYSKAALWAPEAWAGLRDRRAEPLFAFLDLVATFQPSAVLMENVPGFVRGRRSAFDVIASTFDAINRIIGTSYAPECRILNAADVGVPQNRERAIVVAFRNGASMQWPELTHVHRHTRAWDALRDVELHGPTPPLLGGWADLLPSIPEGWNYVWHTDRGGGRPLFGYRTRYWSFLLKLAKDRPSWTLPAQPGPSTGPFHWDNRPLHTREMLRLQTFPESWIVEGTRREQVLQVGNATPPLLAEVLGRRVASTLGLKVPQGPPTLRIPRARIVPPAAPVQRVPPRFRRMEGDHLAHPGSGRGPRPRTTA